MKPKNKKEIESQFFSSLESYINTSCAYFISDAEECGSPIESMFFSAMQVVAQFSGERFLFDIECQQPILTYRVDFVVSLAKEPHGTRPGLSVSVIVECDGHDFHEKTKEQASKDKKRDRELQAAGFNVFRFSGSDIWKDVFSCAQEVFRFLISKLWALRIAGLEAQGREAGQ